MLNPSRNVRKYVSSNDYKLMRRVNQWIPPRWFRLYMLAATRLGDFWIYVLGTFLLGRYGGREAWPTLQACLGSGFSSAALCRILKRLINRRRPFEVESHSWAKLLPPDQFSFPSLHTTIAFAVAVPISLAYPLIWFPVLFLAFSIGASRILLGMHFLSDVLAGMCLGTLFGGVSFFWLGPA